jgi:hypothetical protein
VRFLSLRLIVSPILAIALVSLFFSIHQVRAQRNSLRRDLEKRAEVLAESLQGNIEPLLDSKSSRDIQRVVQRFENRERAAGIAVYDNHSGLMAMSSEIQAQLLVGGVSIVPAAIASNKGQGQFLRLGSIPAYVYALPLHQGDEVDGALAIVKDTRYIHSRIAQNWRETILRLNI